MKMGIFSALAGHIINNNKSREAALPQVFYDRPHASYLDVFFSFIKVVKHIDMFLHKYNYKCNSYCSVSLINKQPMLSESRRNYKKMNRKCYKMIF